jgi:hypothetical protein
MRGRECSDSEVPLALFDNDNKGCIATFLVLTETLLPCVCRESSEKRTRYLV